MDEIDKGESVSDEETSGTAATVKPAISQPVTQKPAAKQAADDTEWKQQADQLNLPTAKSLTDFSAISDFVEQAPISYCRRNGVLAVAKGKQEYLAFSTMQQWQHVAIASTLLGRSLQPLLSPPDEIQGCINRCFEQKTNSTNRLLAEITDDPSATIEELIKRDDLLDSEDRAPVIQLVNSMLFESVRSKASDIHIQPRETEVAVRMRIDGILFDAHKLPKTIQEEVVTRMKVLGKMNIAEKRLPQDGRASVKVGQRAIDLRIASMPTNYGERVVIRLLDKSARMYSLEELGMDADSLTRFRSVIHQEHGLILVTGPTGSGKSTTLYSVLQELNTDERNAVTLEDPIEYELDGISQTQINVRKGMTFASGLRSVLRQDPDIIMLGEIRDEETALMAIQSSLTGHMVYSTLHTNDAPSAVTRLLDLGVEPYLASSSLLAVLAQRLVRRICPSCRQPVQLSKADRILIGLPDDANTAFHGEGCLDCRNTGYQGRFGVFELLMATDAIQQHIQQRSTAASIRAAGIQQGMRPMRQDGLQKILDGKTTVDEVARVTTEI